MEIRNPIEWGVEQFKVTGHALGVAGHDLREIEKGGEIPIARIGTNEIKEALVKGFEDFGANRTDVIFICIMYPLIGLVLARFTFGYGMLPLLFPLASGFALIGPLAAIGLYEMSRKRELGADVSYADALGVVHSPSFGAIILLGVLLTAIFVLWLLVAEAIYMVTLGPQPPASVGSFVHDVFTTGAGWMMIVAGIGIGFLFAVAVLAISVVSFPLLLDRHVGVRTAVRTSVRAVAENPRAMALWGLIVAASLVVGSIPLFLGLIIVLPVLGHATWHLYRKVVPRP